MSLTNDAVRARDLAVLWHPTTQMKDHEWLPLLPVRRARGVWLEDFDGNRYIDAISSWWVNLFGHTNPDISAAVARQAAELEHVILAGVTHEPAVRLAERLVELTPPGLNRVFLAVSGSEAIQMALKMPHHYSRMAYILTVSGSLVGLPIARFFVLSLLQRTRWWGEPVAVENVAVGRDDVRPGLAVTDFFLVIRHREFKQFPFRIPGRRPGSITLRRQIFAQQVDARKRWDPATSGEQQRVMGDQADSLR